MLILEIEADSSNYARCKAQVSPDFRDQEEAEPGRPGTDATDHEVAANYSMDKTGTEGFQRWIRASTHP